MGEEVQDALCVIYLCTCATESKVVGGGGRGH